MNSLKHPWIYIELDFRLNMRSQTQPTHLVSNPQTWVNGYGWIAKSPVVLYKYNIRYIDFITQLHKNICKTTVKVGF